MDGRGQRSSGFSLPGSPSLTRRRAARLAGSRIAAAGAAWWTGQALVGPSVLAPSATALGAESPPLTGLLVTVAATAEGDDASPTGGALVVELTLTNAGASDLSVGRFVAAVPARAGVATSWQGHPDQNRGAVEGQTIRWSGFTVRAGERLPPFSYRLKPLSGENGAVIFRQATVQPEVAATLVGGAAFAMGPGSAVPPVLPLNGLWGDDGLRRTVLPTGLTVLTRERPDTATVSLRLAVRAGSRDEDDTTSGGSHWLEHAFFLGTETRPTSQAIDNAVSAVGGVTNASTGWEHTDYWKLVPAEDFDLALDVLADQLLHSTFRPEAFERERRVVFEELKQRNDDTGTRAFDEFIRRVFVRSPLRRDPGGTIESVQAIPIPTILAYKDQRYRTGNMAVAAVGRLRHQEAVEKIERALSGLPRGPRDVRPPVAEPVQREPRLLDIDEGSRLAEMRLGWPVPGDLDADAPAMYVLEDILGTTGRRLNEEIRDRRALATSVGLAYLSFSDAGALMIFAATQPERVAPVLQLALAEVQRLRDGAVTDEDVATSLRAIAGRRALGDELNQNQAQRAVGEVTGTIESFDEYLARLRAVRPADVQRVAQKYLDPVAHTLVVVRR